MEYANYSEHVYSPSIPDIRSCASMIFILRIHAIGVPEGVALLEFEGASQEEEPEVQEIDEAATEEELPECPDHQPSSFIKGTPWSILSLPCFYKYLEYLLFVDDALSIGIGWNQLLHYISILVQISHWNPI